ncbi:glycosyltransferase family 2 protein [Neorhizobium sp. LMR1-1-1.1]
MAKIAIIVLNWNGWRDTNPCLESLLKLENEDLHVYVCDNASSDESIDRIRAWVENDIAQVNNLRREAGGSEFTVRDLFDLTPAGGEGKLPPVLGTNSLTLLQTGRNGGYAFGNNVGMRLALNDDCEYFWIINNDTEVEPDALTWLHRRIVENPDIGICGSTLVYAGQRDRIQALGGAKFLPMKGRSYALGGFTLHKDPIDADAIETEISFVNGASMFVSRDFLTQVGLMKEEYFLYWEEIEWSMRARGRFRLGYAPKSVVYHKVGASIGTKDEGESSPLSDYYMHRNQIWFCWQYSKISLPFVVFNIARSALRYLRAGKPARAVNLTRALLSRPYVRLRA